MKLKEWVAKAQWNAVVRDEKIKARLAMYYWELRDKPILDYFEVVLTEHWLDWKDKVKP